MDILNFISWIRSGRVVNTVDPAQALLPVGLKDNRRDDGYLAGAISVEDFTTQIVDTARPYKVLTIGSLAYADTTIYNSVILESTLGDYEFAFDFPNILTIKLLDYTSIGIDLYKLYVVSQQVFGASVIFQTNIEESNLAGGEIKFFCRFIDDVNTFTGLDLGNIEIRIYN